jgi:iron complex transport system substrate-binding protein
MVTGVDDMETRRSSFRARPYALAHPGYKQLPTFGEFRGHDNPEHILNLSPQPDVIFKTFASRGTDPDELARKTGIPVVVLEVGDLGDYRQNLYHSLRIMGEVIGKEDRAQEVIDFFEKNIREIGLRSRDAHGEHPLKVYIGGVASRGPHGFQSTEPDYPPFRFVGLRNVAYTRGLTGKGLRHSDVAKEKILEWDPDVLFLDLSTLLFGEQGGGLYELRTDPAYRALTAVLQGKVYGVLPYNLYSQNYGSILANAWFIGKTLFPDGFRDIDPKAKADAIYTFLVGSPVFDTMNQAFDNLVFTQIR